jgi:predicted transposase/invertase (TIGR01784 family)
MKFLDVKTDYAFKKVFGSEKSKDILKSFLNAIVYDGEKRIKDLEILDPYNIPMIKGMKDTYVDVKAVLDDNSKVIIEMQVLFHTSFEKRILYNAAKNYSKQLNKGDAYGLLNPVIALTIVDFEMFPETDKVITKFKLLEKDKFIEYSDDIELIFVELPKFKKSLDELEDIKDEWIFFVKNAGSLEYIPENFENEIKKALSYVDERCMSEEELEAQYKRIEFLAIQKLAIDKAKKDGLKQGIEQGLEQGIQKGIEQGLEQGIQKGLEQGIQKGIEQGIQKGIEQGIQKGIEEGKKREKLEIARNLLDILDDKTIALKVGLNENDIKKLREELK